MDTFFILLISVGLASSINPQPKEINIYLTPGESKVIQLDESAVEEGINGLLTKTTSTPLVTRNGAPIDLAQRLFFANNEDLQFHRKTLDLSGLDLTGEDVMDILHNLNESVLSQVAKLDLSNNRVTGLPLRVWPLQLEYSLCELYLDHNRLDMGEAWNRERVTRFELLRLLNLKKLSLSHCGLTSTISSTLLEYPRVESLDLSGNRLIELPNSLTNLATLQYLDVSGNNIRYLSEHPLSTLSGLRMLNLSNNGLERMWDDPLEKLYKLESLHLDHNSLTEPPKLYQYTGSYQPTISLFLAGNAFHCGCPFKNMVDNVRINFMDDYNVTCVDNNGAEWLMNTSLANQCSPYLETVKGKWSDTKQWVRDNRPDWSTLYRSLGWVLFGITMGLVYAHNRAKKSPPATQVPYNILDDRLGC